ncbi:YdcF family protein [Roseomonas sp. HJA6]|uniref:YdcF family protein n=1 Tax=Roseomonas alba TaxID=2846776 RepID=A0ABS7A6V9_9PROT|nr:YdcF family protein [Neoroseomonas alba]MBW6397986.1 YdcF family protein [Neoroseomonas alba]
MSEEAAAPAPPRRRRRLWWVLGLVLGLAIAFLLGFAVFVARAFDPAAPSMQETDGIVVLTGGSERVATGLRLLAEGRAPRLLISGAHPEAGLVGIIAAAGHDPAPFTTRVAIGRAAATTRGNAVETAAWARAEELHSLRVVTASYHMPRALLELRRAMRGATLVPHAIVPSTLRAPGTLWKASTWALLFGEYGRYLLARAGLSALASPRREIRDS